MIVVVAETVGLFAQNYAMSIENRAVLTGGIYYEAGEASRRCGESAAFAVGGRSADVFTCRRAAIDWHFHDFCACLIELLRKC